MSPELYSSLDQTKVIKETALRSGDVEDPETESTGTEGTEDLNTGGSVSGGGNGDKPYDGGNGEN